MLHHPTSNGSAESGQPARLAHLRESITERLRHVCDAMPEDEFKQLVESIATIAYKYEQRRVEDLL